MTKQEDILNKILIFMKNEVSKAGATPENLHFDFSTKVKQHANEYSNAPKNGIEDAEDLANFKKTIPKKYYDSIIPALNEGLAFGLLEGKATPKYKHLIITTKGVGRATSVEATQKTAWKNNFSYCRDKIFVPLFVAVITTVLTTVLTNYLSKKNIEEEILLLKQDLDKNKTLLVNHEKEIELLKKEITWKQKQK